MTPRVHSWGCLGFKTLLPQLTQVWNNRPVSPLPPCSGSLKAQHIAWSLFDSPWLLSHWMRMATRGGSLYWGILAEHWILVTFLFSCFSTTLLLWKKHWRNTNTMIHIKSFFLTSSEISLDSCLGLTVVLVHLHSSCTWGISKQSFGLVSIFSNLSIFFFRG